MLIGTEWAFSFQEYTPLPRKKKSFGFHLFDNSAHKNINTNNRSLLILLTSYPFFFIMHIYTLDLRVSYVLLIAFTSSRGISVLSQHFYTSFLPVACGILGQGRLSPSPLAIKTHSTALSSKPLCARQEGSLFMALRFKMSKSKTAGKEI